MTDVLHEGIIPSIPNFQMQITDFPNNFVRVKKAQALLEFVGPKWPIFVYIKEDDPDRPGDVSSKWIFIRHDSAWFGALL